MKKNLLILLFFAFVVNAKADILVEPYVGINVGGTIENSDSSLDEDLSGTALGARLGWQQLGLFLALDYRITSMEYSVGSADIDVDENLYSAVVGYDFPILFRVWGQYVLGGEGKIGGDGDGKFKNPSGTILGVGFTGLPFVSLNLEMANYKYDKVDSSSTDTDISTYLLSVSLPLTF